MHLRYRDVNEAFRFLVEAFVHDADDLRVVREQSRIGEVLRIPEPVIIEYSHPLSRVLFNEARDANPFFHLFEALWMLAGCNQVEPLAYYNSRIGEIASDDGVVINDAYGKRWRHAKGGTWFGFDTETDHVKYNDQLSLLIDHLKRMPNSRRAVLSMWNVEEDLLRVDSSKSVCCNTEVHFSLRIADEYKTIPNMTGPPHWQHDPINYRLDMKVNNRSNDLIWGTLGSDYVTFSFLQEYVACCLGVQVGTYYQDTNNLHVYSDSNSKFEENASKYIAWNDEPADKQFKQMMMSPDRVPLVKDKKTFDEEVKAFVAEPIKVANTQNLYSEPFLRDITWPMCAAYYFHKERDDDSADDWLDQICDHRWQWASRKWIERRRAERKRVTT